MPGKSLITILSNLYLKFANFNEIYDIWVCVDSELRQSGMPYLL